MRSTIKVVVFGQDSTRLFEEIQTLVAKHGMKETEITITQSSLNHTSNKHRLCDRLGITGLTITKHHKSDTLYVTTYRNKNGRHWVKSHSINKYGIDEAIRLTLKAYVVLYPEVVIDEKKVISVLKNRITNYWK